MTTRAQSGFLHRVGIACAAITNEARYVLNVGPLVWNGRVITREQYELLKLAHRMTSAGASSLLRSHKRGNHHGFPDENDSSHIHYLFDADSQKSIKAVFQASKYASSYRWVGEEDAKDKPSVQSSPYAGLTRTCYVDPCDGSRQMSADWITERVCITVSFEDDSGPIVAVCEAPFARKHWSAVRGAGAIDESGSVLQFRPWSLRPRFLGCTIPFEEIPIQEAIIGIINSIQGLYSVPVGNNRQFTFNKCVQTGPVAADILDIATGKVALLIRYGIGNGRWDWSAAAFIARQAGACVIISDDMRSMIAGSLEGVQLAVNAIAARGDPLRMLPKQLPPGLQTPPYPGSPADLEV